MIHFVLSDQKQEVVKLSNLYPGYHYSKQHVIELVDLNGHLRYQSAHWEGRMFSHSWIVNAQQNQLVGKHVFAVSRAILSRPLSLYCSMVPLLTLNMGLLANPI